MQAPIRRNRPNRPHVSSRQTVMSKSNEDKSKAQRPIRAPAPRKTFQMTSKQGSQRRPAAGEKLSTHQNKPTQEKPKEKMKESAGRHKVTVLAASRATFLPRMMSLRTKITLAGARSAPGSAQGRPRAAASPTRRSCAFKDVDTSVMGGFSRGVVAWRCSSSRITPI